MAGTIENRSAVKTEYRPNVINGYELLKPIKPFGNQASVYLAQKYNEDYVIKIYNSPLENDMGEILRCVQTLNHNAIAEIIEFGESEGHAYEIQRYYDPQSCSVDPKYFVPYILRGINHALSELHLMNIVHLDIKPENLYISKKTVKLLDFGISTKIGDLPAGYTSDYAAPEVIENGAVYMESDYYSLGITIFELLMGYNPFSNVDETYKQQLKNNPLRWLPYKYMDTDIYELLFNLVTPLPKERWGFSEVNHWIDDHDDTAYSEHLNDMIHNVSQITSLRSEKDKLSEFIDSAVTNGNENKLFDDNDYDTIKIKDTKLAFLIGKYKNLYIKDSVEAAIKLKKEYSNNKHIAVPGRLWNDFKEAGIDLLNYATKLYDAIVNADISRFENKVQLINFNVMDPTIWSAIKNGYIIKYVSEENGGLFTIANNVLMNYIKDLQDNYGNIVLNLKDMPNNRSALVLEIRYYGIIYIIAAMGYVLSGIRTFMFNGEEYHSLNELYDHLLKILDGNENDISLYSRYLTNYTDQSSDIVLQPILQALSDITNQKLLSKLTELNKNIIGNNRSE